ncbi:MAG: hypothetical protein ACFNWZ_00440 [Candidatus Absconditicoccaceae bacterium]
MSRTKSNFGIPNKTPDNTSSRSGNWYKEYSCIIEKPTYEGRPKVTQERPDGSSDGLFEALDIDLGGGKKACSNWEKFDKKGTLEQILPPLDEPTAEELVAEFYKKQEHNSGK